MKYIFGLCALAFVGSVGWQLGGRLSSDAIGMALGILFGIMAGIPAGLIVLAAKRDSPHSERWDEFRPPRDYSSDGIADFLGQGTTRPPVIIVSDYGPPSLIDPRLTHTGQVNHQGYHLMQASVGTKVSEMARQHSGYSVARFGGYIGMRPNSPEAERQLTEHTYRVIEG